MITDVDLVRACAEFKTRRVSLTNTGNEMSTGLNPLLFLAWHAQTNSKKNYSGAFSFQGPTDKPACASTRHWIDIQPIGGEKHVM